MVPENVAVGVGVINMTANDPDEGLGGEIKYELLDEGEAAGKVTKINHPFTSVPKYPILGIPNKNIAGLFIIEPSTGEIRTRRPLTGRGRTPPYSLMVAAADGGGLTADATLTLYIGDVSANDGVPRFITPSAGQTLFVSEVSA